MSSPSGSDRLELDLAEWRGRVLTAFLWMAVAVAFVGGAVSLVDVRSPGIGLTVAVVGGLELFAALRPNLGYRTRARLLLGGIFAANTVLLVVDRYSPNTLGLMSLLVLQATLLLGRRWGVAATVLSAIAFATVTQLHRVGIVPPSLEMSFTGLVRTTIDYVILATVGLLSVAYLLDRAERLLGEKVAALAALEREQRDKTRIANDLRARESALQKARELEILGRLAGSITHDFNNALLIIQASVDLARHDGNVERAFTEIEGAVRQAAATTRQLRAFGPQRAQGARLLALDEVVKRSAGLLERILPKNIRFEVSIAESGTIRADEGQVLGVITNLALNARDAMPEGGRLSLGLRAASAEEVAAAGLAGSFAAMEVVDEGTGMSPETLERVFEPFFTTKGSGGSGLGLASVKDVVRENGGGVSVASGAGRGATFTVFWPLDEGATGIPSARPPPRSPGALTVLLVDDDEAARRTVTQALAYRGYRVMDAANGADGLLLARRYHGPIHVLCTDCVMPGLSVRQLVEGVREAHPETRVILCSGYVPMDAAPAPALLDAFLAKPFSAAELAAVVEKLAGGAHVSPSGAERAAVTIATVGPRDTER
ncbi:MAG: ATP-binding protein [Polyangiaceae bacterium]